MPADGSAPARRLTHHPAADLVVDWRPDGKAVLFASTMASPRATYDQFHTIDVAGSLPQRLPLPYGETATYTSDGKALLFTYQRDFQEEAWKRYYGGRAPDIWRFDFATGATQKLTNHPSSDSMPMQIAGRTYFLSERDAAGRSNIWRLGEQGAADSAVTTYIDTDVRRPATDGLRIIFEVGGGLAIFDPATGGTTAVTVRIDPASVVKRSEEMPVGDRITSAALSPGGVPLFDWLLMAATVIAALYIPFVFHDLAFRVGNPLLLDWVMGTILIVLLQSVLSVMQMPEAGRQIIYGIVIIAMLLAYGRGSRLRL